MTDNTIFPFKLGIFDCYALRDLRDGTDSGPIDRAFDLSADDPRRDLLPQHGIHEQEIEISYTCLLLHQAGQWTLVDAGRGTALADDAQLLSHLAALDIDPAQIATVFLSHGHGDHYGGMVHEDGSLVFAAARHFMPRGEWEHWTDPAYLRRLATDEPQRLELLTRYLLPLEPALTLIEAGKEILPGFQAITAPGHTVAHTALRIESEGDVLYYLGDAMLHPLFGIYPDWQFFNDVDHRLAARTRQQLREGVTVENALVLGYHFPFPLLGRFSRHDTDYTWQPFTPPVAIND